MSDLGPIVVGVDGSAHGQTALRWAVDRASRTGQSVRAVSVWHFPPIAYTGSLGPPPFLDPEDLERAAGEALEARISELGDTGGVEIERCLREGQAADVLIEESKGADLLAVGSRGRGGFRELLLGSVSHQCAQHAECPVLIVRRPKHD